MAKIIGGGDATPTAFTPAFATQDHGLGHPWVDPAPPFILVYSPQRYMVLAGKVVPSLSRMPLIAGVNRVDVDRDGRIRFAAARARLEEEGRIPIPYEWGPKGDSYLQTVETRPNGSAAIHTAHITVFETCHAGDRDVTPDEKAYAGWLAGLVKAGKLPPCPPHLARRMLEKAQERFEEAEAMSAKHGGRSTVRAGQLKEHLGPLRKLAGKGAKVAAAPASLDLGE